VDVSVVHYLVDLPYALLLFDNTDRLEGLLLVGFRKWQQLQDLPIEAKPARFGFNIGVKLARNHK
jgi:hypothetical protein